MSTTNNRELEELEGLSHHELAALALGGSRRITHLESSLAEKDATIKSLEWNRHDFDTRVIPALEAEIERLKKDSEDFKKESDWQIESRDAALTALREKHRWISIAERLPERERYCLIRYKGMCAMHYKAVWLMDATLWTDSQGNVYPVQPTDEWRYITPPDTSQPIENQGIWSYNIITPPDTKEATDLKRKESQYMRDSIAFVKAQEEG